MRFALTLASCLLVACAPALSTTHADDPAAQAFAAARQRLLDLPPREDLDPTLAPDAQQALSAMRQAAADFVAARVQRAAFSDSADTIARDIAARAADSAADGKDKPFGDLPTFVVAHPESHPELLAVTTQVALQCGEDATLQIFERAGEAWRERIRWQSKPHEDISAAFGFFDFAVSPSDEQGQWYVLVKSIAPWCSSTWSTVRYAILRSGSEPAAPHVVFSGDDSIWWGSDDAGALRAQTHDFELRFHSYSIDTGVHNRVYIRRYAIQGNDVRRTQPVAVTPRDFADEWIVSPWDQAKAWSAPGDDALARWHKRLHGAGNADFEFLSVHACSGKRGGFQVAMENERESTGKGDTAKQYFLRIDGADEFTLIAVADHAWPNCRGADLLDSMQTK